MIMYKQHVCFFRLAGHTAFTYRVFLVSFNQQKDIIRVSLALVQGLLVFLQQKSLEGEFEGKQIYFTGLPFCWRVSHEGVAWEKAKGHLGVNK